MLTDYYRRRLVELEEWRRSGQAVRTLGLVHTRAREAREAAMADLAVAVRAAAAVPGASESLIAREAGLDRSTVRSILGK